MSASSTQRFTAASSFARVEFSFCGLRRPESESTEGIAVSRFVGEGKGRQITTLFFARGTTLELLDAEQPDGVVRICWERSLCGRKRKATARLVHVSACHRLALSERYAHV